MSRAGVQQILIFLRNYACGTRQHPFKKQQINKKNTKTINQTIKENNSLGVYDVITARAFASAKKIIKLTKNNSHQKTRHILLKGKKKIIQEELRLINKNQYICEIINKDTKKHERNIVIIKNNEQSYRNR